MSKVKRSGSIPTAVMLAALAASATPGAQAQTTPQTTSQIGPATAAVSIGATDIGGVVTGPNGPEAGVWVIAETTDLPHQIRQDRRHRRPGPLRDPRPAEGQLQGLGARLRARGLARRSKATPGKPLEPDRRAGAERGGRGRVLSRHVLVFDAPASRPTSEFPGTGDESGNGIQEVMKTQHSLGRHRQELLPVVPRARLEGHPRQSRRQLGDVRQLDGALGAPHPVRPGAGATWRVTLGRLGPEKGLALFADWTDRIAGGELPFAKPERPQGVERNVVISMWDWSDAEGLSA